MDFGRLQQMLANMPGRANPAQDTPMPDTAEKIQISSLSLLKMLKHGISYGFMELIIVLILYI